MHPIEIPQNARAPTQGNQRDSNKIRGYGIAPSPEYQGFSRNPPTDKGRSRSRSKDRKMDYNSNISGMKDMYRRETYDLLVSPNEATKKIRASSPATRIEEIKKEEEEMRPASLSAYGIAPKKNHQRKEPSNSSSLAKGASTNLKHKGSDSGARAESEQPDAGNNNQSSI
jgi:hypothetical protein